MLKKHSQFFARMMMLFDAIIVAGSGVGAYFFINRLEMLYPPVYYLWLLPVLVLIWGCLLIYLGMYESFRIKSVKQILGIVFTSGFFGFIIFGNISYLSKLTYVSRILMISSFVLAAVLLAFEKIIIVNMLRCL